jgi:hypothetical protein
VLSFVGAGVGSAVGYAAALRQTRTDERNTTKDVAQRREQARHEEWGRRFTLAIDGISSEDPRRRSISRVLLVHLAKHGGDESEQALARTVLEAGARIEQDGELLDAREGILVDNVSFEEENEDEAGGAP